MKLRPLIRAVTATALLAGLFSVAARPAQAVTVGSITFASLPPAGGALLAGCDSPGLGTPGTLQAGDSIFGMTVAGQAPNITPDNCGFTFGATTCVNTAVNVLKTPKALLDTNPACTILSAGSVTGFCGLSFGTGTATIGPANPVSVTFVFTAVGGTLVVTGEAKKPGQKGFFAALVNAAPPTPLTVGGGSCAFGTATTFTLVGGAVFTMTG